jgi:uncharacterized membrane protein
LSIADDPTVTATRAPVGLSNHPINPEYMATVTQQRQPTTAHPRSPHDASRSASSSSAATMAPAPQTPAPAPAAAKKAKGKKAADPSEQQKQIQAKIAQLELDQAGDKEQELEIGGYWLLWPA